MELAYIVIATLSKSSEINFTIVSLEHPNPSLTLLTNISILTPDCLKRVVKPFRLLLKSLASADNQRN